MIPLFGNASKRRIFTIIIKDDTKQDKKNSRFNFRR